MALAEYYVDPTSGSDATGNGTSDGTAWATVQKALNTITQGTFGDRINVKVGSADVLSASLTFATYGVPAVTKPLVVQGYTTTAEDGGIGEIDSNGNAVINDVTLDAVFLVDMKVGSSIANTNVLLALDNNCGMVRCEIYGSSNTVAIDVDLDCLLVDCYIHTVSGTKVVFGSNNLRIFNCYIDGTAGAMNNGVIQNTGNDCKFIDNIVHCNSTTARGMSVGGPDITIVGNTLYNAAAGTDGAIWSSSGAAGTGNVILNNIIEGWSGTGGLPIEYTSSGHEPCVIVAGNIYYDNATNAPSWAGQPPIVSADNAVPGSSPLNAPGSGDFTVTTVAKEAGYHQVFRGLPSTGNFVDSGAAQREEPAGGGGSTAVTGYAG